jgi:MFS family permease
MSLQNTVVSILGMTAGPLFGALVDATSYRAAFLLFTLAPLVGWVVLRPLEGDEDRRADARRKRLAAYPVEP